MTTTAEETALFILKVLDAAQWNVFPSEAEIETLSPHVEQIRSDYEDQRGRGFHGAFMASRAKFITQALRQAQNDKLEEAAREIESAIEPARQHCRDAVADVDPPEVAEVLFELMDNMVDLLAAVPDGIRDLKSKD